MVRPITGPAALDRRWLRFTNRNYEQRFLRAHVRESLPVIRLAGIMGAAIYAMFGILDALVFTDSLAGILAIRYGFGLPVILGSLLLTHSRIFLRAPQLLLTLGMFGLGCSILAMTAVGEPPGNASYYTGLIIVVMFYSSVLRVHYTYSVLCSLALFAVYQWVAIAVNPIPTVTLINNDFFLMFAVAFGGLINYAQEYYWRIMYIDMRLLKLERARSEGLRRRADAANAAKTRFLANMSHELRTPLNAILGFSEIMQHEMFGPLGAQKYLDYANDIRSSGTHLLNIISDILDLARAETGKMKLNEQNVDLVMLAEDCLRMVGPSQDAAGIRCALKVEAESPRVRGDPRLLRQAAINLLTNAVKFSRPGGAVTLSLVDGHDGDCLIRVSDTGIGMAPEEARRATEPFFQAESVYTRERAGAGLGLPLARKIMELHGGTLELESRAGEGTVVTARIPAIRVLNQGQPRLPLHIGT